MPTVATKQRIIRRLNEYCFGRIWNETSAEYRVNVRPRLAFERFQRGNVIVDHRQLSLPTSSDQYIVYTLSHRTLYGGMNIPRGQWLNAEEILVTYKVLIFAYNPGGKLLPRNAVHVYRSPHNDRLVVALLKKPAIKIFGDTYVSLHMTIYRDGDQTDEITCKSWYINPFNVLGSAAGLDAYVAQCLLANTPGTTVLVNGVEKDQTASLVYGSDDYVEVIFDENVIGSYTVNVSNNTTGYYSDNDQKYREILHCPKSINPTNRLITHNTCTLTVRDNVTKDGRYLHRADDGSVGQITHNDLSVARDTIDAFRDHLVSEDVSIYVRVRTHGSDNILLSELFYLNFLYRCSDDDILRHLRGELDSTLPFWTAADLEVSPFTAMMFDTPNSLDDSILDYYVQGLGYHTIAAILASHVYHKELSGNHRFVTVTKPIALRTRPMYPLVYLRGLKVKANQITYTDNLDGKVTVSLNSDVHFTAGDTISVILVENGSPQPYLFNPTVDSTTITVPYQDVLVYEEIPLATPIEGQATSSSVSYRKIAPQSGTLSVSTTADGQTQVVAGASLYGSTLIVQNGRFTMRDLFPVDTIMSTDRGAIVLPLTITCANDASRIVPLLGYRSLEVYGNSKQLIPNLDFSALPALDEAGNVSFVEIVVSANDYIDHTATGNAIEVVAHTNTVLTEESGFVFDNHVSYDNSINVWYSELGRSFVKGRLLHAPVDMGTYLEPGIDTENGDPYHLTVMLPSVVADILSDYSIITNTNRLKAINDYFNRTLSVDKSFVIVTRSHRTHSPYMAEIIRDIISGTLPVANDPDDTLFMNQFADYAYLKERDPAIVNLNGVVDRRYVDVSATYYTNWVVPNTTMYDIIHRLTTMVLSDDPDSLGDVLNG